MKGRASEPAAQDARPWNPPMRCSPVRGSRGPRQIRPGQVRSRIALGVAAAIVLPACLAIQGAEPPPVDYGRDVFPIFRDNCFQCHDGRKTRSGLRLDERAHALRGGDSGVPALVPGASGKSELMRRVTLARGDEAMPPGPKKLTANQIRVLRAWIDAGALWSAPNTAPDPSPSRVAVLSAAK